VTQTIYKIEDILCSTCSKAYTNDCAFPRCLSCACKGIDGYGCVGVSSCKESWIKSIKSGGIRYCSSYSIKDWDA
jgi:hypothetical protein